MEALARRHRAAKKVRVNRSIWGNILAFLAIFILGAFMAFPLVYAIGNAFKPLDELWLFPPPIFPRNPTLKNFQDLVVFLQTSQIPMSRYVFNTVFVTVAGTGGHIILASMAAYPLAKYTFPGSRIIFSVIVTSLMFSTAVTAIPNYLTMVDLHWIDTYWALIIPAFGTPMGMFLMKQFMEQIPSSLLEAAKIDGAGELRIFWTIVMPNVKPAWLTLMVFSVTTLWNTGASNFIYDEYLKTLPYAVTQIVSAGLSRAGAGSAASVLMMSVPILCFVITQNNIIETMASSGIKE